MTTNEAELYQQLLSDNAQYIDRALPDRRYKSYVFSANFKEGNKILWNSPPLISAAAYLGAVQCVKKLVSGDCNLSLVDMKQLSLQDFAVASHSTEIIDFLSQRISFNMSIHFAAYLGYADMCEYLIKKVKIDPKKINDKGQNALHMASLGGNADTISLLLSYNICNINEKDNNGNTPIMLAAKMNNLQALRFLLTCSGIDPNPENEKGETLLHFAAQVYNTDIVQLVIGVCGKAKILEMKQWDFFTMDCYAVENNFDLEDVKVDAQADKADTFNIDIKTKDGNTPLMYAAASGCVQTFLFLMQKGASLYEQNYKGQTCLHLAVQSKDIEMVKTILKPNIIDINIKDTAGNTALLFAAKNGSKEIAALLLEQKLIDVNVVDMDLESVLHVCARLGDLQTMPLILNKDLKINLANHKKATALMLAVKAGSTEMVKLLLEKEMIDVNCLDIEGNTPLHASARFNQIEIAKLLVTKKGIDLNIKDNDGWSPLHYASRNAHIEIVKLLIAQPSIQINIEDKRNKTPFYFAMNQDVRTILQDAGAE